MKPFEKYLSEYGGIKDWHLQAFQVINKKYSPQKVLYAGSWIHITPSLAFPNVVYVDLFSEMEKFFTNTDLISYITKYSKFKDEAKIEFHQADYRGDFGEAKESFDLLISLSSGFVSQACFIYLRKGGLLLANNEHYDAVRAYVDSNFKAIGVFKTPKLLVNGEKEVESYFVTTKETPITLDMVKENSKRSPSKVKYELKKKAPLYLFQKNC